VNANTRQRAKIKDFITIKYFILQAGISRAVHPKAILSGAFCNAKLHYNKQEEQIMPKLTVTARGQVTFRKEVLQHLGIKSGQKIELELLPGGRGMLKAAKPSGTIGDFIGVLKEKTKKIATIEEINEAAARGWAGKK
jgi:bifunctional DNA-binding transcriptional regulator/antitoxin component of YhaV-PrlF toxin-antitoxin module